MVTNLLASRKRWIVSLVTANLLGIAIAANSALADDPPGGQTQDARSKSAGNPSDRSGSPKARAFKRMRQPDGSGNFVYEIINDIRARSQELCARYGSPSDCLEEAEVCLTMRDTADNQVRLCLNTVPAGSGGDDVKMHRSRARR
jgi:hypothetical protein